jgi:hypothetical protein
LNCFFHYIFGCFEKKMLILNSRKTLVYRLKNKLKKNFSKQNFKISNQKKIYNLYYDIMSWKVTLQQTRKVCVNMKIFFCKFLIRFFSLWDILLFKYLKKKKMIIKMRNL